MLRRRWNVGKLFMGRGMDIFSMPIKLRGVSFREENGYILGMNKSII